MSVMVRGVKNVFRNRLRTVGFAIIIAVSLSLAFSMLLANQAVRDRGQQLREDIGASLLVYPAGSSGGANAPAFTDSDGEKLAALPHVNAVVKTNLTVAQNPEETKKNKEISKKNTENNTKNGQNMVGGSGIDDILETSLHSTIESQQLKNSTFLTPIMPVTIEGMHGGVDRQGRKLTLIEGRLLRADDGNNAIVGKTLAEKNALKIGSTFTVKDKTFTVVGIFDSGTVFGDNRVLSTFDAVRALQDKKDEVPAFLVLGDSLDNLEVVKTAVQDALEGQADVTILQQESLQLAASLKSIETISFVTLLIALAAGALTILLTMLLVVRERIKEIGILKALGATNEKIVGQFLVEAMVLTLISAVIGMLFAAVAGNAVLRALIAGTLDTGNPGMTGGGTNLLQASPVENASHFAAQITTLVDAQFIMYGFGVTLLLAILGTAIPAFLIAKVRPAQIMRGDS